MLVVFLLFLTIPVVSSANPKCPEGFNLFKRVPTLKNNHTKNWCLGIFKFENMGDRDRARSFCIHHDAMLSIPENKKEFDAISKIVKKENISEGHAIDGEVSSRCKAQFFQAKQAHKKFNITTMKGECNSKNRLYTFDDPNTDPAFVLKKAGSYSFGTFDFRQEGDDPTFRYLAQCLTLVSTRYEGNQTDISIIDVNWCLGPKQLMATTGGKAKVIDSVICGRRPL